MRRPNYIATFGKLFAYNFRAIISERTCPSAYHKSLSRGQAWLSGFLVKKLYPLSDMIITNSKNSSADLTANFGVDQKKVRVIYNPINLIVNNNGEHIKINKEEFTFIHVGKFRTEKNHLLLVKAIEILKHLPIKLMLIGSGATMKVLKDEVNKRNLNSKIIFKGYSANPSEFIAQADCMVLSSNFEGFPNALLEGMAFGLPIISTDCYSGPRELLAPSTDFMKCIANELEIADYGILTPVNNSQLLAKSMEMIFTDNNMRMDFKIKGLEYVKKFDVTFIMKDYEELFH